jgi:hypothetical protein
MANTPLMRTIDCSWIHVHRLDGSSRHLLWWRLSRVPERALEREAAKKEGHE